MEQQKDLSGEWYAVTYTIKGYSLLLRVEKRHAEDKGVRRETG